MTRGECIQLQVNVRLCWCDIRLYHHLLSTTHRQGNGPNISASHAEGNFIQNRLINRWDSYDRSRLESRWHLHGSRIRAEIFSHVMLSLLCLHSVSSRLSDQLPIREVVLVVDRKQSWMVCPLSWGQESGKLWDTWSILHIGCEAQPGSGAATGN